MTDNTSPASADPGLQNLVAGGSTLASCQTRQARIAYHLARYYTGVSWLPPRARRRLSADLAAARDGAYTGPDRYGPYAAPRRVRRAIGAGPWPRLRRRAERALRRP